MYCKLIQSITVFRRFILYGIVAHVLCVGIAHGQGRVVTGKVTSSEDSQGLPGTNVIIKGSTQGTVTDAYGNYTVDVTSSESVLIFSSIGYVTEEIIVGDRTTINVAMTLDVTQLSEVVVVGYGTVKKSDVTGALTRVSSEVITQRPVTNLLQALQGNAAGMHVTSNFKPGELPVISIRGNRSLEASNGPLYVIDGIPLISASINDINPNDIASVEILKDASATAIYGSRGANGVILITTKKGSKGKVAVSLNSTVSLDQYHSLTDWMTGGEYIDRWRLALMNGRGYQSTTNTDLNNAPDIWYPDPFLDRDKMVGLSNDPRALESLYSGYEWVDEPGGTVRMRPTTAAEQAMGWPAEVPVYNSNNIKTYDWLDEASRQGVMQNHQMSLSSGTETSRLFISLGFLDQLGVQRDQDFKRYTGNINGEITANKWLTLGTSVIASLSVQNYGILPPNTSNTGPKDLYSRALGQFPFSPFRDENGNYIPFPQANINIFNPLIDVDQSINERRASSVLSSAFGEITFTPWLKYRINFSAQFRNFRNGTWTGPNATVFLNNRPNTASYNTEESFSWVAENLLFIDKTFAENHKVGITLLQSAQKFRRENIGANVTNAIYDISLWYDLAANTNGMPNGYGTGFTENSLMSWMGRVNYSFKDRYLLTASGRFDGSSVLAPGNKWDFFPSFAFAWKAHEETFLSGLTWLNELKLRLGYGVTGNSAVDPYTSSGPLSRNPYVFGATPAIGYLPQLVKNPLLGWEKTRQLNIGLDFAVIDSRLSGSIELYEADTYDLLMTKSLPAVSGYVSKLENIGKTRNRGLEITISSLNLEKGDFSWTTDLNWTTNREEIVELLNGKEDMVANLRFIGEPLQVFYYYDHDGIWQNTAEDLEEMAKFNQATSGVNFRPGSIKVVDQNGDYIINAEDRVVLGTVRPRWTGGMTNTFKYKNWTLSSILYARVGQTYFGGYPNYGLTSPNGRVENDIWSFDNPGGRWPMPTTSAGSQFTNHVAAMEYNDGSFVSIRNISLSYAFPKDLIQKIAINDLELNFQVVNPFMFGPKNGVVRMGINPDDATNWERASGTGSPIGGTNNNTILPQSFVFSLRAGF